MKRFVPRLLLLVCAAFSGLASASVPVEPRAFDQGIYVAGQARVEARLLVHPDVEDPRRRTLGVLFDLAPGWHVYWRNPGESGLAPDLRWEIAGEPALTPLRWPAPKPFSELDGAIQTFGYSERVLLATEAIWRVPFRERREVRVVIELLACEYECIPGRLELATSIPPPSGEDAPLVRQLFEDAQARWPRAPHEAGVTLALEDLETRGDEVRAALAIGTCPDGDPCAPVAFADDAIVFYPDERGGLLLEAATPGVGREPGDLLVEISAVAEAPPEALRLSGVLALRGPEGVRHVRVDLPLTGRTAAAAVSLPMALGLALLGGLILNLMPCVLPVLAIKVFAAVELAAHNRREVIRHALAYVLGIELSMATLATVVLVLRSAGTSLGWGFQLQEPLFVMAVALVLVIFAMNLFGAFEIGAGTGRLAAVGAQATGFRRSFFEGLLAVVLATPCSAPFLGTAVGFAFAASPLGIITIFLAIGAGLAAPFVMVAFLPAWSRWIPRSGVWMLKLRAGLGFALLATVVWLVWIHGRSAGPDGTALLLSLLLAVAFASWLFGVAQAGGRRRLAALLATLVAGVSLAGVGLLRVEPGGAAVAPGAVAEWRAYSRAAVDEALADGERVFVIFTADWCITCKVNERLVLKDERVVAELARLGYTRFRADWTLRDESIRAELARFGKAGVPLYLVYDPASPQQPRLLPELLTPDRVLKALAGEDPT